MTFLKPSNCFIIRLTSFVLNSAKSTIRPVSDDSDSDDNGQQKIRRLDNYNTNFSFSPENNSVDSLVSDDDNYLEGKRKKINLIQ